MTRWVHSDPTEHSRAWTRARSRSGPKLVEFPTWSAKRGLRNNLQCLRPKVDRASGVDVSSAIARPICTMLLVSISADFGSVSLGRPRPTRRGRAESGPRHDKVWPPEPTTHSSLWNFAPGGRPRAKKRPIGLQTGATGSPKGRIQHG
jgi:hypothetical protein